MELVLAVCAIYGGLALLLWYGKWICAALAILCGSKDAMHDFGDLCDHNMPEPPPQNGWRDQNPKW